MSSNEHFDQSSTWTAEQHRREACAALDGLHIDMLTERWPDGTDRRHYTTTDDEGHPGDLGPFLAAIAHALLAGVTERPPLGGID